MLLAGDELGNSQNGNNNAYAQDNETGWIDWSDVDKDFLNQVRELVWLRLETPLLRLNDYVHGGLEKDNGTIQIHWINKDGESKQSHEWESSQAFSVLIEEKNIASPDTTLAILLNRHEESTIMRLPVPGRPIRWHIAFCSCESSEISISDHAVSVPGRSITLLTSSS